MRMEIDKDISRQILVFAVIVVFAMLSISAVTYFVSRPANTVDDTSVSQDLNPGACTMDARACPDGSFVGRNPENNCQFDACPATPGSQNTLTCCDQNDWYNCRTPEMEEQGKVACENAGCAACQQSGNDIPVSDDITNTPVACSSGTAVCADGSTVSRSLDLGCAFTQCADGSIPKIN